MSNFRSFIPMVKGCMVMCSIMIDTVFRYRLLFQLSSKVKESSVSENGIQNEDNRIYHYQKIKSCCLAIKK